jgi:hypothetical protein
MEKEAGKIPVVHGNDNTISSFTQIRANRILCVDVS